MHGMAEYPIIALDKLDPQRDEPMGTQPKLWFTLGAVRWLFKSKEQRPLAGQDWAEKIAGELADVLGIPHAHIELAAYRGWRGTKEFVYQLVCANQRFLLEASR